MNLKCTVILLLVVHSCLSAQEMFFGKPVNPEITKKIIFWKYIYGELDSSKTVIFNKKTLQTYAEVTNDVVNETIESLKKRGENPNHITIKQGRKEFVREAIFRADTYPFIVDSLAVHHLHTDLRWLPVLESGYLDTMVSDQDARGIWQFIPSTAKMYGLSTDEISDVYRSTHAFVSYFSALYREFGDYGVALTAYHHGEGGVRKKLRLRKSTSLKSILPDLGFQSRNYYAKYLAIVSIAHRYTSGALPDEAKSSQELP